MYAENWDVLLREVINHQVCDLTVYVHQPKGLPSIEISIELWVLVDEALQKFQAVCPSGYLRLCLSVIIAEGLKGFLVAIGIDPHQD